MDINFCNSSRSYEGAMKPGMFCAGRQKEGLLRNISKENQNVSNLHTNLYNSLHSGGHDACQVNLHFK